MACCSCFRPTASSAGFSPNGKKYSRELQSFSELIYDAGNKDEGRLGGYGSTSGLLRRRNGPGFNMGPTYEHHRSAVDDLQDTLRVSSWRARIRVLQGSGLILRVQFCKAFRVWKTYEVVGKRLRIRPF
jgi:hypothetical protein